MKKRYKHRGSWFEKRHATAIQKAEAKYQNLPADEIKYDLLVRKMSVADVIKKYHTKLISRFIKEHLPNLGRDRLIERNKNMVKKKVIRTEEARKSTSIKLLKQELIEITLWNGEKHMCYLGGKHKNKKPYLMMFGGKRLHHYVFEKFMPIPEGYDIHHIDGDKLNNHPSNLCALKHEDHTKLHKSKKINVQEFLREKALFITTWSRSRR